MTIDGHLPLVDLEAQYRSIRTEIDAVIDRVLQHCGFILGEEVSAFENSFAAFCGTRHCLGVANGTDALELALEGIGIRPGDEVVTVAHTFIATAEAIVRRGAIPVFVDVCPDTLLLDVSKVEVALTPKTKAIVPVHLYGQCVDMDPLLELAARRGLPVVEDACQAHGATYKGKVAGSMGKAAAFSFYPGKNLGAYGDAGAVTTSDDALAGWIRQARNHGRISKYSHEFAGRNSRMAGLQGAVLQVKLAHLHSWNTRRRILANELKGRLNRNPHIKPVVEAPYGKSVYHLFVIQVDDRDGVVARLQSDGIEAGVHYPMPLHRQPAFKEYSSLSLPVTEAAAARILSLPLWPEMEDVHLNRLTEALNRALAS